MKRITYIDGLKGLCALSICIFHFLLMFIISGYIGWKAMPEAVANPFDYYFEHFPYSILTNNSFPLYIFFAIMSFLITYIFIKNSDESKLKKQAITRYFRFLPIVVIACFFAYLLLAFELCDLKSFYEATGNEWALARLEESYSFWDFIKISFFSSYMHGTQLLAPLWCLHYLFLGSFLTYFILLIYNKIKNKTFLFGLVIVFIFFFDPNYLAYVAGIIAGVIASKDFNLKKFYSILLILGGCIFGLFPPVLLPTFVDISVFYAVGAGLILVGTHASFKENFFLTNKFVVFCGKESLSLIIFHFLIQQSLNVFLFLTFNNAGLNLWLNILINFVISMTLTLLCGWISSKTITPLTNKLCNKISDKLISDTNQQSQQL